MLPYVLLLRRWVSRCKTSLPRPWRRTGASESSNTQTQPMQLSELIRVAGKKNGTSGRSGRLPRLMGSRMSRGKGHWRQHHQGTMYGSSTWSRFGGGMNKVGSVPVWSSPMISSTMVRQVLSWSYR